MKILFATSAPISILLLKGQAAFNQSKGATVYFSSSYDEKYLEIIKREGFEFLEIDLVREISIFKDFKSLLKAIKILRKIKPDIVNASTPKAGLIFMIASFFVKGVYPVFTLRGLRSDTLIGLKGKIVWFTEYLTCLFAKKVIVIAPSLRDHAVNKKVVAKSKTVIIGKGSSNGIQIQKFNPNLFSIEATQKSKKELNIKENSFVFGYVGRIVNDKGIYEMYEAFKRIKHANTYLILAGEFEKDDCIPENLKTEILNDSQVRCLGFVDNIPKVLALMDVLILFSYREGFGNVVLEAACMSKPALVTDIPGLKDTVENNETGFIIKYKNVIDLSDKMNYYIENKSLAIEHGSNGRKRVIEYFDSNVIHKELFDVYQKVYKIG